MLGHRAYQCVWATALACPAGSCQVAAEAHGACIQICLRQYTRDIYARHDRSCKPRCCLSGLRSCKAQPQWRKNKTVTLRFNDQRRNIGVCERKCMYSKQVYTSKCGRAQLSRGGPSSDS